MGGRGASRRGGVRELRQVTPAYTLQMVPVTDAQIGAAVPFPGHRPRYHDWPAELWKDHGAGVPDQDPGRNAWHVRTLAEAMLAASGWVGPPVLLWDDGRAWDGSHRLRAVEYLRTLGVEIPVPVESWRVSD